MSANLASPAPPLSLNAHVCREDCCRIDELDSLLRPTYLFFFFFLRTGDTLKLYMTDYKESNVQF